jgi:hypothetical protein
MQTADSERQGEGLSVGNDRMSLLKVGRDGASCMYIRVYGGLAP